MLNSCLSLQTTYIPVRIRRKALKRDNYKCVWCGELEEHRLSHFIQRREGGQTLEDNLVTTCEVCKRKRHYDSPAEFISRLKLEQIDFPREVKSMRIKVIFASGQEVEGMVNNLPKPEEKAFYLHPDDSGMELIYTMPGMRLIKLGGEK